MSDINIVVLTGNLTRDPELKATSSGSSVLDFGIASNRSTKNANGEWEDVPNFIDCTIFGKRADALEQYLAKGMKVTVEGELRYSSWTDKDGNKRSKLKVVANNVILPPRQKDSQPAYQQPAHAQPVYSQAPYQQPPAYQPTTPAYTPPQQPPLPTYTSTPPVAPYSAPQQPPAMGVYDEDIPF